MNVATTYQLKKMVIVQNFKNLMFKAMCNSHQHLYLRKTKGHIQGLLQSNKGRRYKKHNQGLLKRAYSRTIKKTSVPSWSNSNTIW